MPLLIVAVFVAMLYLVALDPVGAFIAGQLFAWMVWMVLDPSGWR